MNLELFHNALLTYQQRNNLQLAAWLDRLPASALRDAMKYGALLGGKRIRPFLCYAIGETFGAPQHALDTPAAAIECMHAYSLIHDDLPAMDNDDLRRGQPTCHIAFDEATAILAGDALQTLAFSILARGELSQSGNGYRLEMIQTLAEASGALGMCLGQAQDLAHENSAIDLATLEQIHRHKTGALICASVRMAVFACGESALPYLDKLDTYASAIGLAFQVQDDILDIISDTQTLGKPQGSDLAANKSTYPALLGLDGANKKAQQLVADALQVLDTIPYNTTLLEQFAQYIIARNS